MYKHFNDHVIYVHGLKIEDCTIEGLLYLKWLARCLFQERFYCTKFDCREFLVLYLPVCTQWQPCRRSFLNNMIPGLRRIPEHRAANTRKKVLVSLLPKEVFPSQGCPSNTFCGLRGNEYWFMATGFRNWLQRDQNFKRRLGGRN